MAREEERKPMPEDGSTISTVVVRSARPRKTAVRGFEGFSRIEQFCKSLAVAAVIVVIGIGCFSRFYAARFAYLDNPIAMEQAEIAKHLRSGDGFTTSIGYLPMLDMKADGGRWVASTYHPMYSLLLSGFFRVRGASDRGVALFNGLAHLATGLLIYLVAVHLRGRRTAILAVLLYYVSIEAIGTALSSTGLTFAALFLTLGIWSALKSRAAQLAPEPGQLRNARLWSVLTGFSVGMAYLCGGLCVLLVIPITWLAVANRQRRKETWALICGTFLLVIAPWVVRNLVVSGTLTPVLSQYQLMAGTPSYPGSTLLNAFPDELPNPVVWAFTHPAEMAGKLFTGSVSAYRAVPSFINIYLFPFLVLFGLGVAPSDTGRSVWRVLLVMLGLQLFTALLYNVTADLIELDVFLPLGLCLAATAVAAVLSTHVTRPVWRNVAALALLGLVTFPYATSLLGTRTPGQAAWAMTPLNVYLASDAVIGTDAPAPAAWYSGRRAVLLPRKLEDIGKLKTYGADPDYVFLTGGAARDPQNPWAQAAFASSRNDKAAQKLIGKPIVYSIASVGDIAIYERNQKRGEKVQVGARPDKPGESRGARRPSGGRSAQPPANRGNAGR